MATRNNGRSLKPGDNWMEQRPGQGYSFDEVIAEMERRMRGEYIVPPKMRESIFTEGSLRVAKQYRLAAVLSDFMAAHELTSKDLLDLVGCSTKDDADTLVDSMLNPYHKGKEDISLHSDIDAVYPGKNLQR